MPDAGYLGLVGTGGLGTQVGSAFIAVTADTSPFKREMAKVADYQSPIARGLGKTGVVMQAAGSKMTRYLTLPLVALGGAATKMASDFDTAMTRVSALAGVPQKNLQNMRNAVLALSGATGQAPTDLANALYFVASAGLKASQVLPVLEQSAKGATAQLGDAATIGHLLTGVLVAYGKDAPTASQAMDVLTTAIKRGKAEPADLAGNLGTVIPVAAELGISFDQLAGAIAASTNVNIGAARAATGLRYMLTFLSNPTEKATKTLASYGFSLAGISNELKTKGLLATLHDLADTLDITTAKGKQAFFQVIGGVRAGQVALALVGQSYKGVKSIMSDTAKAAGDSSHEFQTAYEEMRKTPEVQFQIAFNKMRIAMIDAGQFVLPIAQDIVQAVGDIAGAFSHLPASGQQLIVWGGLVVAALGPVLYIIGTISRAAAGIVNIGSRLLGGAAKLTDTQALTASINELNGSLTGVGATEVEVAGAPTTALEAANARLAESFQAVAGAAGEADIAMASSREIPGQLPLGYPHELGTGRFLKTVEPNMSPVAGAEQLALPFGEGAGAGAVVAPEAASGLASSIGSIATSAGEFAVVVGGVLALGGGISQLADQLGGGGAQGKMAARSYAGGLTMRQQAAVSYASLTQSNQGLNPFKSEQDILDEANKRYLTVIDEARKAHMNLNLVIPKLGENFSKALAQIGGVSGNLPAFQQELESIIGLKASPGYQQLTKYLTGLTPTNIPLGATRVPGAATTGILGRPVAAFIPRQINAAAVVHAAPLQQQGMGITTGGPTANQKQVLDIIAHMNTALAGGAKVQEVLTAITGALKGGLVTWGQYTSIVSQLGTKFPLAAAGQFQNILLRSSKVTEAQGSAFAKLMSPLTKLHIDLPKVNADLIRGAITSGNMKLATELLAGSLRSGVIQGLRDYHTSLTKAQIDEIQSALKAGEYRKALQLLQGEIDKTKNKQDGLKGSMDASDKALKSNLASTRQVADNFTKLGAAIDHMKGLNISETNTLRGLMGQLQATGHNLTNAQTKALGAAAAAGNFARMVQLLTAALQSVPKAVNTSISLRGADRATAQVKTLHGYLSGIAHSWTIALNLVQRGNAKLPPGFTGPTPPHTGRYIYHGGGQNRWDEMSAVLQRGEYVVNKRSTQRYRGLLDRINSGTWSGGGPSHHEQSPGMADTLAKALRGGAGAGATIHVYIDSELVATAKERRDVIRGIAS